MDSPDKASSANDVRSVRGLAHPVEIAIDRWGIAHIRAEARDDLFFAQGYNAARDRLWQIDLWRKRGLGLLAADFGPGYLAQDHASRLFLYRGDMEAEWAAYAPDAKEICEAFTAGINAYVDAVNAGELELPQEFQLFGTKPARWQAQDVVRIRSHCLTRNAISEILRANVMARAGAKADALRKQIEPAVEPFIDEALGIVPLAAIDVFKLATAGVSFSPDRLDAKLEDAPRWKRINTLGEIVRESDSQGSNNWVVSGARTETGRPIMATDPHRTHAVPSLRYMVHLAMPGFDAIGAGEPAVPGISLGHNGHSAFSLTIFGADQEDVYVYETDPANPKRYRYGDGWEEMVEVEEVFEVRHCPDQKLALRFTRHGPVMHEDRGTNRAYALRTVWTEPGSAPYMASLSVMRATSLDAYRDALSTWGTPSINHLYADVGGTIAWQTVGKTPIRPNWNGLAPVPGDGRYEWQGHLSLDQLPSSVNPQKGFLATANEMNLPQGWDWSKAAIGFEWVDKSRSQRIHRVLGEQPRHRLSDSCALQNDLYSEAAARMQKVLREVALSGEAASRAARHLLDWDCITAPASSAAALFEIWVTRHLKPALYTAFGADEKLHALLQPGDIQSVLEVMEQPDAWFGVDGTSQRRRIVEETLAAAWQDCVSRLGADAAGWQWGKVHRLILDHAVAGAFPQVASSFSVEPIELGGSSSTPMYAAYRPGDFAAITGPSVRMVIDVGAWDNSVFVNLPGQSGDPRSPHYQDLKQDWLTGRYHQLAYSREAVDAVTEHRILLNPAR